MRGVPERKRQEVQSLTHLSCVNVLVILLKVMGSLLLSSRASHSIPSIFLTAGNELSFISTIMNVPVQLSILTMQGKKIQKYMKKL